ncbi:Protein transport protein SEC13 [Astathelohania contejeani]|uniref:Protein transport protein SEC13 n=1 Tax=Astathelohania contejeani TaxID=164912 RepID=A0ABQ7I2Q5_9MICR|nr:Protein transport protein SEC13 [Thelohania contejeani]
MEAHTDLIHSIDSDLSEQRIVTASSDKIVRVFNVKDANLTLQAELKGHNGPVTKAIFLNKGEMIASCSYNGTLIIWKLEGNNYGKKYEKQLFNGSINSICCNWHGDSFTIYSGCSDGRVRTSIFDSTLQVKESDFYCHRYGVSTVSSNEKYLVTGGMDSTVGIFRLSDMSEMQRFKDHSNFVRCVAICPKNEFGITCFASCSDDGTAIIYNLDGGFSKQVIKIGEPCYSLGWSRSGFSLTIGYGESKFKTFIPDASGKFKETDMEKL